MRKTFLVRSVNRKGPEPFIENGEHFQTDAELFEFLVGTKQKWYNLDEINIEEITGHGPVRRIDLELRIITSDNYQTGESVTPVYTLPLPGKSIAPELKEGTPYTILEIYYDRENRAHLHVGLQSKVAYVTSYYTGEVLPESHEGGKHWCLAERFKKL